MQAHERRRHETRKWPSVSLWVSGVLMLLSLVWTSQVSGSSGQLEFKNIYEAIQSLPELKKFAQLCEAQGVKEIVSMDKTPLTVFAPIDVAIGELLTKQKSHPINLVDLAKHHIAQGLIAPDETSKYPLQFFTYSNLSPVYLSQQRNQPNGQVFVNNAKILATHLIAIDAENFQTLHLIDQTLEFAYLNRRTQLRSSPSSTSSQLASSSNSASGSQSLPAAAKKITVKRTTFSLDDLYAIGDSQSPISEFYERFGDLAANQPQVDLFHTRVFKGSEQKHQRISIPKNHLSLEHLASILRRHPELKGKLYNVNETNQLNTYFLPVNSDDIESLLESATARLWEAHVVPDEVLFTRTMAMGVPHSTLLDSRGSKQRVSLSLAKTLPHATPSSDQTPNGDLESLTFEEDAAAVSRRLLATPLLLQSSTSEEDTQESVVNLRAGVTSAEILVANIPLSNGVLHLIKRPLISSDTNLLDFINDNNNQLSDVINSVGTQTLHSSSGKISLNNQLNDILEGRRQTIHSTGVNKFRELLARERQLLSSFSMEPNVNRTILAPSDEAFARLRYDLRALVQGDESLIPKHWDSSYRQDLIERLVKRHLISGQVIESHSAAANRQQQFISDNGKILNFMGKNSAEGEEILIECDSSEARILHKDLIATNGILHVIDRVLGEDQETVSSLLKSIVLKFNSSMEAENLNPNHLNQLVQVNLREQPQDLISNSQNSLSFDQQDSSRSVASKSEKKSPELESISRSIGQYLDELAGSNRRQLQLLANSVNISFHLAKLTSMADGLDDWNDRFKSTERQFTYFVPSDLAWIKLQQTQPELFKPLMYFLDSQHSIHLSPDDLDSGTNSNSNSNGLSGRSILSPRSSESSHRLRQVLERHLAVDRRIEPKDIERLDSIRTLGATLRLMDSPSQHQLTALAADGQSPQATSSFSALHSIATSSGHQNQQVSQTGGHKFRSLKFGDSATANIVQVNEAVNGFVYIIDGVFISPEDTEYIMQTSATPAISSTMSSLLGAHNSAILDFIHNLISQPGNSMHSFASNPMVLLIGTLTLAISILLVVAMVLVVRRRRLNKLNRHQQLESGLTSSSSANSGSTSTTKSL